MSIHHCVLGAPASTQNRANMHNTGIQPGHKMGFIITRSTDTGGIPVARRLNNCTHGRQGHAQAGKYVMASCNIIEKQGAAAISHFPITGGDCSQATIARGKTIENNNLSTWSPDSRRATPRHLHNLRALQATRGRQLQRGANRLHLAHGQTHKTHTHGQQANTYHIHTTQGASDSNDMQERALNSEDNTAGRSQGSL